MLILPNTLWLRRQRLDLSHRPARVTVGYSTWAAAVLASCGLAGGAIVGRLGVAAASQLPDPLLPVMSAGVMAVMLIVVGCTGIAALLFPRTAIFETRHVEIVQGAPWQPPTRLRLPYSAFEGVRLRREDVPGDGEDTIYHLIELVHRDPTLSIPLLIMRSRQPPTDECTHYAFRLGVPVLA